jgi:hypothetical protein
MTSDGSLRDHGGTAMHLADQPGSDLTMGSGM